MQSKVVDKHVESVDSSSNKNGHIKISVLEYIYSVFLAYN